jgi:hypothetical protein
MNNTVNFQASTKPPRKFGSGALFETKVPPNFPQQKAENTATLTKKKGCNLSHYAPNILSSKASAVNSCFKIKPFWPTRSNSQHTSEIAETRFETGQRKHTDFQPAGTQRRNQKLQDSIPAARNARATELLCLFFFFFSPQPRTRPRSS